MKDFFLRVKKRMTFPLLALTFFFAANLLAAGKFFLMAAVFMGYVSSLLFIIMQASRIKSCEKNKRAVKLKTFWGVILRVSFIFIVFSVAAKMDTEIFAYMVGGFLSFYVVFYFFAIIENLRKQ